MKKRFLSFLLVMTLCLSLALPVCAADYYFTDRNGNEMMAPDGAFASSIISFTPGSPWTSRAEQQKVENALGIPDYSSYTDKGDLNLGYGGVLVLGFDCAIYDGDGLDVYVFEVGGDVEPTKVEVSNDLTTWYEAGTASGETAGVDLNGKVPEGSRFRYVRLTDMEKIKSSAWPGADIDAVSGLNVKAAADTWAESEITQAEEMGLVPDVLKKADLTKSITRAEFAAVSVKVYESLVETEATPSTSCPFTDCSDAEVLKAYDLGITNGTSDTTFSPDLLLTREQAAAMLTRTFKRATMDGWTLETDSSYSLTYTMPSAFSDDWQISGYARDSVYFMAANGIIKGFPDNTFRPNNSSDAQTAISYANATREQALIIAVRMIQNL